MISTFFIIGALFAGLAYFVRNNFISHLLHIAYTVILTVFTISLYVNPGAIQYEYFKADGLCLIFLAVQSIIAIFGGIHYMNYAKYRKENPRVVALHNMGRILFNMSIAGVLLSNHFGFLWAFMEATTLTASLLIYHDRSNHALEGTWKYIFICSIGIAIAFAGILFLSIGAHESGVKDLFYSDIFSNISKINPLWLQASFLFIVTGFSVKMGLVPLFNVDIDAKDVSPSPVGAKLSSVLMNAGFVSIFRFYQAFSNSSIVSWMNHLLIIVGVLSLVFVVAYALKVDNVKRLWAYSSMEHASLVVISFACGGYFAAILHLIIHSLVKSNLFFQFAQMHRIYGSKNYLEMGSYLKHNPLGSLVLFLSFIAIIGLPPSGMFISEILIFKSIIDSSYWWLAILVGIFLLFIIYGIATRVFYILMSKSTNTNIKPEQKNNFESILQLSIIGLVFFIGVVEPQHLVDQINSVVQSLPK